MTKKKAPRHIGKKTLDKAENGNFHIAEFKNSKIYLAPSPDHDKDDIHILNVCFSNMFSCVSELEIEQRQNIICWGAEGLVVLEGSNQTISKTVAKETSLALHLDLPVWVLRNYHLSPVYAVVREWQGVKENETKWASIILEGEETPPSPSKQEFTIMSDFSRAGLKPKSDLI